MLSIVVPVYGAPELLDELVQRIDNETHHTPTEIILVVDNCPMLSWEKAKALKVRSANMRLILINLSNNVGQHRAIWEGLKISTGDKVVVMDCDLQDDPSELPKLMQYSDMYDAVVAVRTARTDPWLKKMMSGIFWRLISILTGVRIPVNSANYGVYSQELIRNLVSRVHNSPFLPLGVITYAKSIHWVSVKQQARTTSESSYTISKLIGLALRVAISFSRRPFTLLILASLFALFLTIFICVGLLFFVFTNAYVVPGWASIILVIAFFGNVNIVLVSVLGLYVVEIFENISKHNSVVIADHISIP